MEIVGAPIVVPTVGAAAPAGLPPKLPAAKPPAAPPATASVIHSHLRLPRETLPAAGDEAGSAMLASVTGHAAVTRASPFAAVIRISTGPGVRFQRMPQADAIPSARVVAISVRDPVPNTPEGPLWGSKKLTEAPATAIPEESVTCTVTPRAEREPTGYTAPSPSTMRIRRAFELSCAASTLAATSSAAANRSFKLLSGYQVEIVSGDAD
jgi:hypothetical protein